MGLVLFDCSASAASASRVGDTGDHTVIGTVINTSDTPELLLGYGPRYFTEERFSARNEGQTSYVFVHNSTTVSSEYFQRLTADANRLYTENSRLRSELERERDLVDELRGSVRSQPWKDIALGATTAGMVIFGCLYIADRKKGS